MAESQVPYGRKTQKPSPVPEVHIVWMTSGLGCDGDSVSITAAMHFADGGHYGCGAVVVRTASSARNSCYRVSEP